jgi:ATP phosphoribosyltransferase
VNTPLVVALPKGRVLEEAVALLLEIGVDARAVLSDSRQLVFDLPEAGWRVLVVRGSDVPTYVEGGAADVGIVGQDVLLERGADLYEPLDLGIGGCRLVCAEPEDRPVHEEAMARLRVGTKYPEITRRHFLGQGKQVDIIHLHGAIELAPLVGLCDRIVDLTASGETLRQNRLRIVEEILPVTSRLIVNRASLKTRGPRLRGLLAALEQAVRRRKGDG